MPLSTNSFATHTQFEIRFECPICFSPRLCMVYGQCQHRICASCLYQPVTTFGASGLAKPTVNYMLRESLSFCPICGMAKAFPAERPIIPDDGIEIQKHLGVIVCVEKGCREELWQWDHEKHMRDKHHTAAGLDSQPRTQRTPLPPPATPQKPRRKRRHESGDPSWSGASRRQSLRSYRADSHRDL